MRIKGQVEEKDLICSHSEGKVGNSPLRICFGSRLISTDTAVDKEIKG